MKRYGAIQLADNMYVITSDSLVRNLCGSSNILLFFTLMAILRQTVAELLAWTCLMHFIQYSIKLLQTTRSS